MKISLFNLFLIFGSLLGLVIGLARTIPFKLHTDVNFWFMTVFLIFFLASTYYHGGSEALKQGALTSIRTAAGFSHIMILLMPLIGFGAIVARDYQEVIMAGVKGPWGYVWSFVAAVISPSSGGLSGLVKALWVDPILHVRLLYFLTTVALVNFPIFLIRRLGLGPEITWPMYGTNWLIAIILAPCFWSVENLLRWWSCRT